MEEKNTKDIRFWEIDFARGIAIILMIVSNLITDLNYFNIYRTYQYDFWWFFARATASAFIFLVGVSLTLSYARAKKQKQNLNTKFLKRGLKIFSWGLILTLVTWIFAREGVIIFGVLHFIGIAIILAYPLIRLGKWNLFLATIFIIFGLYLNNLTFDFSWLLWLGFIPKNFYTLDYFPIFPWFGVVLLGLFFGILIYQNGVRKFKIKEISNTRFFCFLGRNSLLIYLIHQPILIGLIYFFVL